MSTPTASVRLRERSASTPVGPKGTAVSLPRVPAPRSQVLAARIREAESSAARGQQVTARERVISVTVAGATGAAVEKTVDEAGSVVGAPLWAFGLLARRRIRRRCQAVLESDAVFKTAVIASGFLSALLTMMALLSAP